VPKIALSALAKERRYSYEGVTYHNHYYLGAQIRDGGKPGIVNEPEAFIVGMPDAGAVLRSHFHAVDQYQVVIGGDGRLGKERFDPISIHYADAYTPYGPIVAGLHGIRFFVLRAQTDNTGGHFMPEARHEMKRRAGRTATYKVTTEPTSTLHQEDATIETLLAPIDNGLGAFLLRAGPNVAATAPDPKDKGGQIHVVTSGSAIHQGQELPLWSCIHVSNNEGSLAIRGGPSGMELLVLQFGLKRE
jgi:hypothetical protein